MSTEDAIRTMDAHVKELMAIPGVVGVAVGALDDGTPCILVLVSKIDAGIRKNVPPKIEGYPVKIEVTGEIRPMSGDSRTVARRDFPRPGAFEKSPPTSSCPLSRNFR